MDPEELEQEELAAHSFCESCDGPTCSCGAKCSGYLMEATPETVPGWRMIRGLAVCVECADKWAPEQADLQLEVR